MNNVRKGLEIAAITALLVIVFLSPMYLLPLAAMMSRLWYTIILVVIILAMGIICLLYIMALTEIIGKKSKSKIWRLYNVRSDQPIKEFATKSSANNYIDGISAIMNNPYLAKDNYYVSSNGPKVLPKSHLVKTSTDQTIASFYKMETAKEYIERQSKVSKEILYYETASQQSSLSMIWQLVKSAALDTLASIRDLIYSIIYIVKNVLIMLAATLLGLIFTAITAVIRSVQMILRLIKSLKDQRNAKAKAKGDIIKRTKI